MVHLVVLKRGMVIPIYVQGGAASGYTYAIRTDMKIGAASRNSNRDYLPPSQGSSNTYKIHKYKTTNKTSKKRAGSLPYVWVPALVIPEYLQGRFLVPGESAFGVVVCLYTSSKFLGSGGGV